MKNEFHQTQAEWSSSSDSECNEIGLVICQVLSAVDLSEADSWIVDSGVTCHICYDRRSFVEIHTLKKPQDVMLGDGHALSATEASNVILELVLGNGKTNQCRLHNVLYVLKLVYNLLGVSKAEKRVKFYSNDCQILDRNDKVVVVGVRRGNLSTSEK